MRQPKYISQDLVENCLLLKTPFTQTAGIDYGPRYLRSTTGLGKPQPELMWAEQEGAFDSTRLSKPSNRRGRGTLLGIVQ
jgi:hypothetical protein